MMTLREQLNYFARGIGEPLINWGRQVLGVFVGLFGLDKKVNAKKTNVRTEQKKEKRKDRQLSWKKPPPWDIFAISLDLTSDEIIDYLNRFAKKLTDRGFKVEEADKISLLLLQLGVDIVEQSCKAGKKKSRKTSRRVLDTLEYSLTGFPNLGERYDLDIFYSNSAFHKALVEKDEAALIEAIKAATYLIRDKPLESGTFFSWKKLIVPTLEFLFPVLKTLKWLYIKNSIFYLIILRIALYQFYFFKALPANAASIEDSVVNYRDIYGNLTTETEGYDAGGNTPPGAGTHPPSPQGSAQQQPNRPHRQSIMSHKNQSEQELTRGLPIRNE